MMAAEIIQPRNVARAAFAVTIVGLALQGAAFSFDDSAMAAEFGQWGAYAMGAGAVTYFIAAMVDYIQTSQVDA